MLSIVILTRNTKALLEGLLNSLEHDVSLADHTGEVIVVDNGSSDGTDQMIAQKFPRVCYRPNRSNRGFAAAVNEGYRNSSGDLVLFLNSDTRFLSGEMIKMLEFIRGDSAVGVVAPQLVYEDMRFQRSFAFTPSLAFELLPRAVIEAVSPGRFATKGQGIDSPREVESLIGAALLVRRDVLERLYGFDERFFFFLEETDFCLRARDKGYKVVFFPGSKLIHLQGRTVKQTWIRGRIEYAISLYKFIRKYHSSPYYAAFVSVRLCKTILFLLPVTVLPVFLLKGSIRRKYSYYLQLLLWHLRGCPDNAGLRL